MDSSTTAGEPQRTAPLIRSRLVPPPAPEHLVARPRVHDLIRRLVSRHRLVLVCATPGAGKTIAVAEATRGLEMPVAWLTVDRTDTAPGRLVTYLEAALAQRFPDVAEVATRALPAGISHVEATGLLAESVGERPVVVVLDDLERLGESPEGWSVVEALLRYAPPAMRVVLLSRREIPTGVCELPMGAAIAAIGEGDLAFTEEEAAAALRQLDAGEIDAVAAVRATGGWVTGVLFEAWRSADHVAGVGGEADPLYGYLSAHILGGLAPEEREFLVTTSILDVVDGPRARALGIQQPDRHLEAIRQAHLPVSWGPGPRQLRCHTRFREYLLDRLQRRGADALQEVRAAHGRLLAAEGQHEEATEELLRAGLPHEALEPAQQAVFPVIERLDFAIAERWLAALVGVAPDTASPLTVAELMLAVAQDHLRRGVRIADQLASLGERERLAAESAPAAALMGWCYLHAARIEDVLAVLGAAPPGPEVDAIRYAAWLMVDEAEGGKPVLPEVTGGPLDGLAFASSYFFGRLRELAAEPSSPLAATISRPYRIGALRALGRTAQALELYDEARKADAGWVVLHAAIGPELLIDAGRLEPARAAVASGRELARTSGSLGYQMVNAVAAAKLALRLERDPQAARAVLEEIEQGPAGRHYRYVIEHVDTWYGLALLLQDEDAAALVRLRRAVAGMVGGDRLLELPTAAVYLAEAEWRHGDEDAADRAADLALEAAERQGSNHVLLQALADFPAVVSRRLDSEPRAGSPWHGLGRALRAQGAATSAHVGVTVRVRDLGAPAILVDGAEVSPGLSKSHELLAYLCAADSRSASRQDLLDALFGRNDDSARAYLRQAIHRLRNVLPGEGVLVVDPSTVALEPDASVTSDAVVFEAALAEAARSQGADRLNATLEALALHDRGPYLADVSSPWADERRRHLDQLAAEARYDAAELQFQLGRPHEAGRLVEEVLRRDPWREAAWRLSMRIAEAVGDEAGVLTAFKECERSLATLRTTPSPTTYQLLEALRR